MNKQNSIRAFTLIELIVWITIIIILLLWTTQIDFNRLSQKQELEILTNNIKSNFEILRNNSLSWKWIWTSLIVPDSWMFEISNSNSWTVANSYLSWGTWYNYENQLIFKNWLYISWLKCLELDKTLDDDLLSTWTWWIIFKWWNLTLTWSCNTISEDAKILEIEIKNNKSDTKTLQINMLNWLAEAKK